MPCCPRCGGLSEAWRGSGTGLKPAHEPIVLARVPLEESSIARQVLATGTGAMNLGACRIQSEDAPEGRSRHGGGLCNGASYNLPDSSSTIPAGRHPPNILLGHPCDEGEPCHEGCPVGDLGGRAKFFPVFRYQAKPSKAEREAGLEDLDSGTLNRTNPGGLENDPRWAPRTRKNTHPTVKPRALMAWLSRLVCPPGGVILDPFTGSGSTGMGAADAGCGFLGIEMGERFAEIARLRIAHAEENPEDVPEGQADP